MTETLYITYWRDGTKGMSGNGTKGLPYTEAKEVINNLNQEHPDVHHWLQSSQTDTRKCYYLGCRSWAGAVGPTPLYQCEACDRLTCHNCATDHMVVCQATYRIPRMKLVRRHAHIESIRKG